MKKRNYIWKIVVAIATVIIPLVIFFTGKQSIIDMFKEGEKQRSDTTQTIKTVTGIEINGGQVGSINQQSNGENNTQYNINVK